LKIDLILQFYCLIGLGFRVRVRKGQERVEDLKQHEGEQSKEKGRKEDGNHSRE